MVKDEKQSKFGRRKFIGHIVIEDPDIDKESNRPIEKRHLITTNLDSAIKLANIPRTKRKNVNIEITKKEERKALKPLHQSIHWLILKSEIENENKKRKEKTNQ